MEIPFYCLVSDTDERALRAAVHQAALAGIQWLVGSVGMEPYVRAEGMECIPLQPEWGGLVRAFSKYCGACDSPGYRKGRDFLPQRG